MGWSGPRERWFSDLRPFVVVCRPLNLFPFSTYRRCNGPLELNQISLVCAKLYGDIDILDRDRFCMKILKFWTVFQCEIGKQTKENPKTEQSSSVSHTNPSKRNLHFFTSNTVQKDLSPLTKFKKTLRVTPHLYPAFCQKLIPLYTYSPPLFVVRVSISFQSTCFIRKLRRRRAQISLHSRNFVKKLCSEKTRGTLLSP